MKTITQLEYPVYFLTLLSVDPFSTYTPRENTILYPILELVTYSQTGHSHPSYCTISKWKRLVLLMYSIVYNRKGFIKNYLYVPLLRLRMWRMWQTVTCKNWVSEFLICKKDFSIWDFLASGHFFVIVVFQFIFMGK